MAEFVLFGMKESEEDPEMTLLVAALDYMWLATWKGPRVSDPVTAKNSSNMKLVQESQQLFFVTNGIFYICASLWVTFLV